MDQTDIGKISRALADETRLRIFEQISKRPQISCSGIVSIQGVTPATVSHHLRILTEAGLIVCRRKGQFIFSYAVPETIAAYMQAVAKVARIKKAKRRR